MTELYLTFGLNRNMRQIYERPDFSHVATGSSRKQFFQEQKQNNCNMIS